MLFLSLNASAKINERLKLFEKKQQANNQDEIEEKKEIVRNIVDSYRSQIISRYGMDVDLIFDANEAFQILGGHRKSDELEIRVYRGALINFDKLTIVTATCHEVGHLLGKVPLGSTGGVMAEDSVEGEADYFAGICSRIYFCSEDDKECPQAITAARNTMKTIYKKNNINESDAASQVYAGIDKGYPKSPCRLLSMKLKF